jgi:cytochrome c oxidase cbb3-type subunit 3
VKAVLLALAPALVLPGCYREKREFTSAAPPAEAPSAVRATSLRPGDGEPLHPGRSSPEPAPFDENAFAVSQGKRFFRWYNCNGCHANGGGGMGPPLMDARWLYGHEPERIYASIVEGRPNGMPAFGGRIPEDQVWQLVAYVRSLSGQLRKDVATSRSDAISGAPPENTRERMEPMPAASAPRQR